MTINQRPAPTPGWADSATRAGTTHNLTPRIVHLGLGNFHRAHQAVYTAAANAATGSDWGIVGVANASRRTVDAMRAQDLRYTVVQISPEGFTYSVPAVHTDVLVAAEDPAAVVAWIADPRIKIVTLTITEHGYHIDPATGGLNRGPEIVADLSGEAPPRTLLGQLVHGLKARMDDGAPLTVLSCDNVANNGKVVKSQILEFCESMPDGARLALWVETNVSFPSTMVDRIVPATEPKHVAAVHTDLGYDDRAPVPAEPFTMWAIEDDFIAGRPAWETHGAIFTDEVDRYEDMKLRLLNGTHSLLAYVGALSGSRIIPDAVSNEQIRTAARRLLRHEYAPSLRMPSGVSVEDYEAQLLQRWRNSALGHQTSQVGSDGSAKLPQRVVEPALLQLDQGRMPHYLALTVAAYLSCVAPLDGFDPGEHAARVSDPAIPALEKLAARASSGRELAHAVFHEAAMFPAKLAARETFVDRVGELIDTIRTARVAQALSDIDERYDGPPL